MAWQNAPVLNKLTASQQGGNRGAQLWGVDVKGKLYTIYQKTPGGEWSRQNDGRVILFTLDTRRRLRYISQQEPGGDWSGWQEFEWNGAPDGYLTKLAAAQRGIREPGAQLWAITSDGTIHGSHQWLPEGRWFQGWYEWPTTAEKSEFIEITAARQHNGHLALWGLDSKRQLWCMGEKSPDGQTPPSDWGPWEGPNWQGAPKLRNIAAVKGHEGAIIWGQDENYRLTMNWQDGKGKWYGWSNANWMGAPHSYELTAAGQNNNCVQLWAITPKGKLTSIAQTAPSCNWQPHWSDQED